ncbi:MAG: glycosyltransferase [Pseudomonadota bacterium]
MSVLPQPAAPRSAPDAPHIGVTDAGEEVISNGRSGDARISVCIPTWRDSSDALLGSLVRMAGADQCTLLIFDDGSHDPALTRQLTRQIMRFPGPARLVCAPRNCGRSHARNRLFALAETEWVLFLDADMQPDDADFLNRYLDAIDAEQAPSLIAGGFSLRHAHPTDETKLHAEQSRTSECVPASLRADAPGRYVFTSNILVHRQVLADIAFDPEFQGWGWEDVDWGLRVAEQYPIIHIDNQATHLGLDTDEKLLSKYANSVDNFLRLVDRHPDEMSQSPLYRAARQLSRLPGLRAISRTMRFIAGAQGVPIKVRLFALKIYRASIYGARL